MVEKKAIVSSKLPGSVAKQYIDAANQTILSQIEADSLDFIPEYNSFCYNIKSNGLYTICPSSTELIDCGFKLKMPSGYFPVLNAIAFLVKNGIILQYSEEERFRVYATNCGKEIVTIGNLTVFAHLYLGVSNV